jgi:hypothetical protein
MNAGAVALLRLIGERMTRDVQIEHGFQRVGAATEPSGFGVDAIADVF